MTSKSKSCRYLSTHAPIKIEKLTDTIPDMHEHEYIEFVYILSGTAQHFIDGRCNIIEKGNYFIVDYKTQHMYKNGSEDFQRINCAFTPDFIDHSLVKCRGFRDIARYYLIRISYSDLRELPVNHVFMDHNDEFSDLMKKMYDDFIKQPFGYYELIRCNLLESLILALRQLVKSVHDKAAPNKDIRIEQICAYIEKNYASDISLAEICDFIHFDYSYISALFKETEGCTFTEYLQKFRIREACHLLSNTDMNIDCITSLVGYSDVKYFRYIFKKYMGMSPSKFRHGNHTPGV